VLLHDVLHLSALMNFPVAFPKMPMTLILNQIKETQEKVQQHLGTIDVVHMDITPEQVDKQLDELHTAYNAIGQMLVAVSAYMESRKELAKLKRPREEIHADDADEQARKRQRIGSLCDAMVGAPQPPAPAE
jgi:hypothetical protein